ncbi:MAG: methionine--tRNA ligase [Candidatus Diapherotrites archaeon]
MSPIFGHAYEKLCADVLARWHRLLGDEVFFLTGTDEHGQKIMKAAKVAGKTPQEFVDEKAEKFRELCAAWNISNDRFIRTTEPEHIKVAQDIFQEIFEKGEIYLGKYSGYYCTECETFFLEKDLVNDKCPVHEKECEIVSEESYFFQMGKYREKILEYLDENPDAIWSKGKKEEIRNRLKEELKDLSVSRSSFDWGVPVPINKKHVQYVWMDALINYISGIDYPNAQFEKFWPADIHIIGKDILWHHTVIWWSILASAGIPLPKTVLVHGFINTEHGEKMSKSKGTVINPVELAKKFNVDAARYYLIREIPFGEDGFFSEEGLKKRNNDELANELGNLVNRTLSLLEKSCNGCIPEGQTAKELKEKLDLNKIRAYMKAFELHMALSEIMGFVKSCNVFVSEKEPWKKQGKELDDILYSMADSLRVVALLLWPFIPASSEKILAQLNAERKGIEECAFDLTMAGAKISKQGILFQKLE